MRNLVINATKKVSGKITDGVSTVKSDPRKLVQAIGKGSEVLTLAWTFYETVKSLKNKEVKKV